MIMIKGIVLLISDACIFRLLSQGLYAKCPKSDKAKVSKVSCRTLAINLVG